MNVFVVLAHPEPLSFNGSMFRMAVDVLMKAGHEVKASDLYAMQFDPVSGRHNFTTVKDPNYFRPQIEEKSRLRKSAQADKWSFCLTAGTLCPANQERQ